MSTDDRIVFEKIDAPIERINLPSNAPHIIVYIENVKDSVPNGRLTNFYLQSPVFFCGFGDMFLTMDSIYDYLNFPQASREPRSFMQPNKRFYDHLAPYQKQFYQRFSIKAPVKKALAVFVVETRFRQNGSWQGTVRWVHENKTQNYLSALQLLGFMTEAIHTIQNRKQPGEKEALEPDR